MKRNDTKGYTLIELIIVLAILSAMLLMASLRADLGTAALRSEAQSVISAMRYTRQ
nr:prepilin-type N-terminal cleavage/methylation domain-containing protein [Proteocatella sp.]